MDDRKPDPSPIGATPVATAGPRRHRSLQLDVLRGIAILLVLLAHVPIDKSEFGWITPYIMPLHRLGWSGVDLFFVLSGFLIGGLLFNEIRASHSLDAKRFLIRRGLKIYPSYVCFMFGMFLIQRYQHGIPFTRVRVPGEARALLYNTLSLQNYLGTPWPHTWSLAVEEHFYLLLPFVLILMLRTSRDEGGRVVAIRGLPRLAAGLIVVCTALRYLKARSSNYDGVAITAIFDQTHYRVDGLFFGVLLAYLANFRPDLLTLGSRGRWGLFLVGLMLIAPVGFVEVGTSFFVPTIGFTFLYLGYGCILVSFLATTPGQGLGGRILGSWVGRAIAFIGVYSYTIYLWHIELVRQPLLLLIEAGWFRGTSLGTRFLLVMALLMAGSTAVGVIAARLVEVPTLRLRDRLFPARSRQVVAPEPETSRGLEPVTAEGVGGLSA